MKKAELPNDEPARLAALERLGVLDTPSDAVLDNITRAAADICKAPIALVTLVDSTRQWSKSCIGTRMRETSRDVAFCSHAILNPADLLEVEDTLLDERFHDNPLVTGQPGVRFYAGQPLVTPDGFAVGTLCVIDRKPRRLTDPQRDALGRLASIVMSVLEERRTADERGAGLGAVLEASANEVYLFDETSLRFVHVNQAARENLGYAMDELRELTPVDLKPEFYLETFERRIEPLRTNERETVDFTTMHRRKDGSTYPAAVHLQRSHFDSMPVFAATVLDATEHTYTEDALSQARLFLESAPDATIIVNAAGNVELANSQTAELFGYTHDELRGLPVETLVPERFRAHHVAHREGFLAAPKARRMGDFPELHAVTKAGREIPIEVSLSPIQAGDEVLISAAIRDISGRKQAARALLESEERYRDLFENANDLIQSVGPDGSLLYVNPAWRRTLGYSEQEIEHLSAFDVVAPDCRAQCEQAFARVMAGETIEELETTFLTKGGEPIYLEGSVSSRVADVNPASTRAIFHNVTKRKQAEEALARAKDIAERATTAKSRFLAAASHDLRQPLQSIGLYLSVLERQLELPKAKEITGKMRSSLDVMGELLDALLDISQLDRGSVTPDRRDVRLQEILNRVITDNIQQAKAKALQLECTSADCVVHTDPALLERVLENFVTNAIRYTDRGCVTIDFERSGEVARISVSDTGIGIPHDALDSIFDEYYQLDNPVRNRRSGLGLGLATVKHIARLLGHPLDVSSQPGEGSTFSVEVPLGASDLEPAHAHKASASPICSERPLIVLLVDDDPAIVDATTMLLESTGVQVHSAMNGDDALAHIESGVRPDLLACDYRLPGYTGVDLIRMVRRAVGEDLPAVLLTGDTSTKEIESTDLPHCTVLHKPVDTDRLLSLLKSDHG